MTKTSSYRPYNFFLSLSNLNFVCFIFIFFFFVFKFISLSTHFSLSLSLFLSLAMCVYYAIEQKKRKLKNDIKFLNLWMKMMNPRKNNNTFMYYFGLFVWGFVLMQVGLGQSQTTEIKVGVVLDLQTSFSKICLTSINISLSDFYKYHADYTTRLAIHIRDSMEDVVQASSAGSFLLCLLKLYLDLLLVL